MPIDDAMHCYLKYRIDKIEGKFQSWGNLHIWPHLAFFLRNNKPGLLKTSAFWRTFR